MNYIYLGTSHAHARPFSTQRLTDQFREAALHNEHGTAPVLDSGQLSLARWR
jgi:hypothetical protein